MEIGNAPKQERSFNIRKVQISKAIEGLKEVISRIEPAFSPVLQHDTPTKESCDKELKGCSSEIEGFLNDIELSIHRSTERIESIIQRSAV